MLAEIYFVFAGYPLCKDLILVLYSVFNMQLAIPAGTTVLLGIAFLSVELDASPLQLLAPI